MVHRDICDCTIGITVIPVVAAEDLLMLAVRGSVIIRILCRQSGIRMTGFMQIGTACFCSTFPELPILLICVFRKEFVEMRQMVRRIAEIQSRYKFDQFVGRLPHRITRMSRFSFMHTLMQDRFCLPAVIKNALSVSPSSRCKEQCHSKILFPVRCRAIRIPCAVQSAGPCKVILSRSFIHVHISSCPLPQTVKFFFLIHLYTNHHPIRHALGSRIMITGILHISHIHPGFMVKALLLAAMKNRLECLLYSFFDFFFRITILRKYIAVLFCFISSCHIFLPLPL